MSIWRRLTLGLRTLLRRDAVGRDVDDELSHYEALATDDLVRHGVPPDVARRRARVEVGSHEAVKAAVRSSGWEGLVDARWQDLRLAVRGLQRSPGFTLTAVLSLTLGIGAATVMFGIADAALWRPLPYADADRLTFIWTDDARRGLHRELTAYATITDWRADTHAFTGLAYFSTQRIAPMGNTPGGGRGRSRTALVSGNLFHVLDVAPLTGRLITDADERDRAPVAVISHGFWQRWFQGAADIVGKPLQIDDPSKGGLGTLTVVGVLPADFFFPDKQTEIFTPATTYWRFGRESTERVPAWARRWTAVGRLAPATSAADAQGDLDRIGQRLLQTHRSDVPDFPGFDTTIVPVQELVTGTRVRASLWILLGAIGLVLLVVCANISHLQLARATTRQREFAVQRALGADRRRLVLQILTESVTLVVLGGTAGVVLAAWVTPVLATAAATYLPRMDEVRVDARVWLFATAVSLVSGLVSGLVPALRLSATAAAQALREGGRDRGGARGRRSQRALVFAECLLALVLLAGAGLLVKSWARLQAIDPGFESTHVLTLRLELPSEPPPSAEERLQTSAIASSRARTRAAAARDLIDQIGARAGVEAVGITDDLFVAGAGNDSITIPGRPSDSIPAGELNEAAVSAGFFSTMHVPLRRGRYPDPRDVEQKIRALWTPVKTDMPLADKERLAVPEPVVVNEAFVRRFFPDTDPVGQRFCVDPTNKTYWYEIVGVVGDARRGGLERPPIPEFYGPYVPTANGRSDLVVRTTGDPLALAQTIRADVLRVMPAATVVSISTASAQFGGFIAQRRLQTALLAGLALVAALLAAIGIFGMVHYAVTERTAEIGIRVALGATPAQVLRLLLGQGLRMPILGIGAGVLVSASLTRLLTNQLYEVSPTDLPTFFTVTVVLALVSALSCYLAARRAARLPPMRALA